MEGADSADELRDLISHDVVFPLRDNIVQESIEPENAEHDE